MNPSAVRQQLALVGRRIAQYGSGVMNPFIRGEVVYQTKQGGKMQSVPFNEDLAGDRCSVCLCDFEENDTDLVKAAACPHVFHEPCLKQCVASGYLQCPVCRQAYSYRVGYLKARIFRIRKSADPLRNYSEFGTLHIVMFVPSGWKNKQYYHGLQVHMALPNSVEGSDLARLLKLGNDRGILFRIEDGMVVPNGLELRPYPDPSYMPRLRSDLTECGLG